MLSYRSMRAVVILSAVFCLLLSALTASAQVAPTPGGGTVATPSGESTPVSGTPPHVGDSGPQVVPTPSTVVQPSVANDVGNAVLAAAIPSPPTPAAWTRQTIPIAPCAVPPKIDGRLDDACWRMATRAAGFFRLGGNVPFSRGTRPRRGFARTRRTCTWRSTAWTATRN